MSILELKNDVIKKLDLLEKNQLTQVSGIVSNLINGLYDEKSIHTLSESEKEGIVLAINDIDQNGGISHAEVISKIKSKFCVSTLFYCF